MEQEKIQYCGEPSWPRGSVLVLRPPGLEFRIPCLERSLISLVSGQLVPRTSRKQTTCAMVRAVSSCTRRLAPLQRTTRTVHPVTSKVIASTPLAWPLALWLHIGPETRLWFLGCDWPASIWIDLGVWLESYSPIGRLSLGIPQRISSNRQYKQVRLVMRTTLVFLKRCFNHLVWHKMLLSCNLKKVEMKLYYNYIYYHSQAYDFIWFVAAHSSNVLPFCVINKNNNNING